MSSSRGLLPLVIATAVGIGNGIYVFNPAFKEQNQQKFEKQHSETNVDTASTDIVEQQTSTVPGRLSIGDSRPVQGDTSVSSSKSWFSGMGWLFPKKEESLSTSNTPKLQEQTTNSLDDISNKKS